MWEAVKSLSTISLVISIVLLFVSQTTNADIYQSIEDPRAKAFGNRVCTTKECAIIAGRYFNNGNKKIDPCDDFATYSCGNYIYRRGGVYEEMLFKIRKRLSEILESPPSPNDKPWHTLAKTFYKKCLDGPTVIANIKADVVPLLDELGRWPLLNTQWNKFSLSYEKYLAEIHKKTGHPFLFKTTVNVNPTNTSEYQLLLQPSPSFIDAWIYNMAKKLGAQNPELLPEIKKFAKEIMLVHKRDVEKTTLEGRKGPLNAVKHLFPDFNLEEYVLHLFDGVAPVNKGMTVTVINIPYFQNLHALFTNKRDFANYAISALINNHFTPIIIPEINGKPRSVFCMNTLTKNLLVKPVAQMYVTKYINREVIVSKQSKILQLTKMVKAIIEVLADMLNNAKWLDNDTRKNALNKLNHMEYSFVHPENLFDDTLLIEKDIPPSEPSESFINLFVRLDRNSVKASFARINQPVDKTEWGEPILTANGFYTFAQNKFHVAVGYLESPYFNQNVPDYVLYAVLGVTAGHEIMHGFDNNGRLYDEAGNMRDWWKEETAKEYVEKASCYVHQYTEEGEDGQRTLGENIGDNVGMELAYKAYKKVMGNATEPALPGFEHFTVDQMFFLSYANGQCTSSKREDVDPNDPHPYAYTRLKMTATNVKEFSKAFKCSKKSPMNPDERCSIW